MKAEVSTLIRDLEAIKMREQAEALRLRAVTNPVATKRDQDRDFIACLTKGGFRKGYRI